MSEILTYRIHRAKKDHKCFWCDLTIEKGSEYHYEFQISDGSPIAIKSHTCCHDLFRIYSVDDYFQDYGMSPDDFIKEMRERNGYHDTVPLIDDLRLAKLQECIEQTF